MSFELIIRDSRLIFVHIQKTGGTAVNRALGVEDSPQEKHRSALELKELYGAEAWDECYKFAFVRNPWARLVSWWSMIDSHRQFHVSGGSTNSFFGYVLANATTFDEFLYNCRAEIRDVDGVKSIFRNQIDYLTDNSGGLMVDKIGRFEEIADDFASITTTIYGAAKPLAVVNASEHGPYQDYYNDETRLLVANAYRRDLDYFGYKF